MSKYRAADRAVVGVGTVAGDDAAILDVERLIG